MSGKKKQQKQYFHSVSASSKRMLPPPPLCKQYSLPTANSAGSWCDDPGSTASTGGFAELERGERIRPERRLGRSNVQKMFGQAGRGANYDDSNVRYYQQIDSRINSMTIADVSPRVAVKRIILLYENYQYREAANFINRLSHGTFKVILHELPVDLFVESMPNSLSILEALYAKVFLSEGLDFGMKLLRPDDVVMQMVKFFALHDYDAKANITLRRVPSKLLTPSSPFVFSCKKLLKVIVLSNQKIRKVLRVRKQALDKSLEGLGQHGLVSTADQTLMNLHDALRLEFQRVLETYKEALQKLEELSLASNNKKPPTTPIEASHQRQLSLRQLEIQERLIKNKTLLNVVEPILGNHYLNVLLGILQRRIECDKDALFQFTQLRKESTNTFDATAIVAPILMRFSYGCDQVLDLMKGVAEDDDDSSDISGYHSDSESTIMLSGNSPYTKKPGARSVASSKGSNGKCCPSCESFIQREKKKSDSSSSSLKSQMSRRPELPARNSPPLENPYSVPNRPPPPPMMQHNVPKRPILPPPTEPVVPKLVMKYESLYAQAKVDTLDALDILEELKGAEELKSKILFSVVVLSYRAVLLVLAKKKEAIRKILQMPEPGQQSEVRAASDDLEASIAHYLASTADKFNLCQSVEDVCSQIWTALYDYPCLKTCQGLIAYVRSSVQMAWSLATQNPPLALEYEFKKYRPDLHSRFHASNPEKDDIRTYLWPALLESVNGPCLSKGVVIT
ncbi:uncharacterized protein LOC132193916 [Neocloeon triangulifer]|uniref:uncharacterized protein LOC132193916 n=1 Tax=Neocloeon triangulifer TaxID=2078957 RepID=UPI00286FADA6|nr:uncharacterized protein LOC132193916 [Neocloeon triangulifer]